MARPSTPADHPTYGIELDDCTVLSIVRQSIPDLVAELMVERLPHGESFNNRLYFISPSSMSLSDQQSFVLKVNGRFFGPEKVENEVCCLSLLRECCPEVPVPGVIAWSLDGHSIIRKSVVRPSISIPANGVQTHGWILMTRLPGKSLDCRALSTLDRASLAKQLAAILSSWAIKLPRPSVAGNLGFSDGGSKIFDADQLGPMSYRIVNSNIGYGCSSGAPVDSLLMYYAAELEQQATVLATNPVFAPTRDAVLPMVRSFIDEDLSALEIFEESEASNAFTFIQYDLAPRNVLVAGSPPIITGLVDFEFAGYFPIMDEFEQEWSLDEDDGAWPNDMYDIMLRELEQRGVPTPMAIRGTRHWEQFANLHRLRGAIAPWWLVQGADEMDGASIDNELHKAKSIVESTISKLQDLKSSFQ